MIAIITEYPKHSTIHGNQKEKMKFKKGDKVIAIDGFYKGFKGEIISHAYFDGELCYYVVDEGFLKLKYEPHYIEEKNLKKC